MPKKKEIVVTQDQYAAEVENNQRKFIEMLKVAQPQLYVLWDVMQQTHTNWFVIVKIIRALNLISKSGGGDGWGEVVVSLQADRVLFIRGINSDRLDEPINVI